MFRKSVKAEGMLSNMLNFKKKSPGWHANKDVVCKKKCVKRRTIKLKNINKNG